MFKLGLKCSVRHVRDGAEVYAIQIMTLQVEGATRIKFAYISPLVSEERRERESTI